MTQCYPEGKLSRNERKTFILPSPQKSECKFLQETDFQSESSDVCHGFRNLIC